MRPTAAKPEYDSSDRDKYKFDRAHFMTDAQIDEWVTTTRHKVMYKDAQNVD